MSVSTGSDSQILPNRAQIGLYTPSEKYVSELTVQGHVSPPAKGLLANENSPGGPIQNVGAFVRMNEGAHAHFFLSPSHRAKPLRQHTVRPSHRRPGREADLSLGKLREAQFPRESVRLPPRPTRSHYTVCCGRSCRAMTSMPMSLALPWPCWSSRTASMALTYVLAADIAVTQVTPRRTASVRSR